MDRYARCAHSGSLRRTVPGRGQARDISSSAPVSAMVSHNAMTILLAVPMWMTWTIRPIDDAKNAPIIASVSIQRLRELAPRLQSHRDSRIATDLHQLVRFNLLNFGEQPVTVSAIALANLRGETLTCDVIPRVVLGPGARYPMSIEVTKGPVAEAVHVGVDLDGRC